jgi:SAM-dependent methyltransferase
MSGDSWPTIARLWEKLGPPLRPSPEDVEVVERVAGEADARRVLLLGVTPELATCAWPEGALVTAVDRSTEMIAHVWPSSRVRPGVRALAGDWRALPLEDGSVDLVAGDGVFTVISYPADARLLIEELARVLGGRGRFVVRAFVPPASPESPDDVVRDLRAGRIRGFHAFKWRFLMSLVPPGSTRVKLGDAWEAWNGLVPDPAATVRALGWSEDVLATIDAYRGAPTAYEFPSVARIVEIASPRFVLRATHVQGYELGERCPTLAFDIA